MNQKLELLAPAGNMEKLKTALYFGADAVYCGGKSFSLRAFSDNFDADALRQAIAYAHGLGKKVYVTANIFARNADFGELSEYFIFLQQAGADAAIVSDIGALTVCRRVAPRLPVHISTQANTTNKHAAAAWVDLGAERIILARELALDEIREISDFLQGRAELEAFVHGAMCVSYSGRCLISNYLTGRDSNRGECVQACRWEYALAERSRTDAPLTLQQDERGSYVLNSKDLNMLNGLDDLAAAGVTSFKIEGRMKTAYYVATVTNAYSRVMRGRQSAQELEDELYKTSHRQFCSGYYYGGGDTINTQTSKTTQTREFVALVIGSKDGMIEVEQRNRFKQGDVLEVLSPSDSFRRTITADIYDASGNPVPDAYRVQQRLLLRSELSLSCGDILTGKVAEGK